MPLDYSKIQFNSQLLIEEMVKRGISVTILPETDIIKAQFGSRIEYIDQTDTRLMPVTLRSILDDKWKTKGLLKNLGFPVIQGQAFKPLDIELAKNYAKELGFPVVIKPLICSHGHMVRMNIDDEDEFKAIFSQLSEEIYHQQNILVEEQIQASEFRLTATRNGFFAVVHRIPPSVIGDGKKSLNVLIDIINKSRLSNRVNCLCDIWIDPEAKRYLAKKGIDLSYIPKKGERVFVRSNSNVSSGGDCLDVTDIVHPFYKDEVFRLMDALPDLPYVGADILTEDITEKGPYVFCELNAAPGISLHTHPGQGQFRDLPKAIIDMLFPETVGKIFSPNIKILTSENFKSLPQLSSHFQAKQNKRWFFKPVMLEMELTFNCNLRCKGCAIIEDINKGGHGLETELAIDILKQAAKIGLYSYSITGGEPFTRFEDILKIIKNSPEIDCYKIQTNGTVFKNKKVAVKFLSKLKENGFGSQNKFITSSLRCSVGMQDGEQGVDFERVHYLGDAFFEVFDKEKANLAFILTHPIQQNPVEARESFIQRYEEKSEKPFDPEGMHVRTIFLHSAPGLKKEHEVIPKLPLRQFLEEYAKDWECFDNEKAETPWPKILVRANGDVYTCSCFGHVFDLGNIREHSLEALIQKANENQLFSLIQQKGLLGFLEEAEKTDPKLGQREVPLTTSVCQACKILKGVAERGKKLENLKAKKR